MTLQCEITSFFLSDNRVSAPPTLFLLPAILQDTYHVLERTERDIIERDISERDITEREL
jgi:hypothetical protein